MSESLEVQIQKRSKVGVPISIFCSIFWMMGGISILLILHTSRKPPTRDCYGKFGPVTYLHRGNLSFAPENTIPSVALGAAALGANPAMDVESTSDFQAVLHNGASLIRMTGVDRNIHQTPWKDVDKLEVLQVIDGHNYTLNPLPGIPRLSDAVDAVCAARPSVGILFDIKHAAVVKATVKALKESACASAQGGSTLRTSIFSTGDPTIGKRLVAELEAAGMENHVAVSPYPGACGPLSFYFYLKTGICQHSASASMISLHKTVWDNDLDTIESYAKMGFCTGVYGLRPEEVARYPSASFRIVDEGPSFPATPGGRYGGGGLEEQVEYDGDRSDFICMLVLGIASLPIGLGWLCFCVCSYWKGSCLSRGALLPGTASGWAQGGLDSGSV